MFPQFDDLDQMTKQGSWNKNIKGKYKGKRP